MLAFSCTCPSRHDAYDERQFRISHLFCSAVENLSDPDSVSITHCCQGGGGPNFHAVLQASQKLPASRKSAWASAAWEEGANDHAGRGQGWLEEEYEEADDYEYPEEDALNVPVHIRIRALMMRSINALCTSLSQFLKLLPWPLPRVSSSICVMQCAPLQRFSQKSRLMLDERPQPGQHQL